jgi:uncharacterized protein (TIGR03435 family)
VAEDRLRLMLRILLADRFRLSLHRERRTLPGYALAVARNGAKLIPSRELVEDGQIKPVRLNVFDFQGISMVRLAEFLASIMFPPTEARPVLDETGLPGKFDFTLDIQRNYDNALDERGHVNMEGNVIRALPLLGLQLVPGRESVEVLVIDRAEKAPTPN